MHGPTCIFRANLTPFALAGRGRGAPREERAEDEDEEPRRGVRVRLKVLGCL
jgi:hypothetical protein